MRERAADALEPPSRDEPGRQERDEEDVADRDLRRKESEADEEREERFPDENLYVLRLTSHALRGQGLVDQHDRYVGNDRIHEVCRPGVEALGDHGLLVAEFLAVLLDEGTARLVVQVHELEWALGLGADENREQLRIDGHRAEVYC